MDSDAESLSEIQELQRILDAEEDVTISRSRKDDEVMMNLTCAAVAVTADEMMKAHALNDVDDEMRRFFMKSTRPFGKLSIHM